MNGILHTKEPQVSLRSAITKQSVRCVETDPDSANCDHSPEGVSSGEKKPQGRERALTNFFASTSPVPRIRTTIGTSPFASRGVPLTASMIPAATLSVWVMPPNMFLEKGRQRSMRSWRERRRRGEMAKGRTQR